MAHELSLITMLFLMFLSGIIFGSFYHNILSAILTFLIIEYFIYLEIRNCVFNRQKYLTYRIYDFIAFLIGWKIGKILTTSYYPTIKNSFIENRVNKCL